MYVGSKNVREFCGRKFYPKHFLTNVEPQKIQKSRNYMQKTDFWQFSTHSPIFRMGGGGIFGLLFLGSY